LKQLHTACAFSPAQDDDEKKQIFSWILGSLGDLRNCAFKDRHCVLHAKRNIGPFTAPRSSTTKLLTHTGMHVPNSSASHRIWRSWMTSLHTFIATRQLARLLSAYSRRSYQGAMALADDRVSLPPTVPTAYVKPSLIA
jgi:hypothetical protein